MQRWDWSKHRIVGTAQLLEQRNTPREDTGKSPAEMIFGYKPRTMLPRFQKDYREPEVVRQKAKRRNAVKQYHDRRAHDLPQLHPGQFTLSLRNMTAGSLAKLLKLWVIAPIWLKDKTMACIVETECKFVLLRWKCQNTHHHHGCHTLALGLDQYLAKTRDLTPMTKSTQRRTLIKDPNLTQFHPFPNRQSAKVTESVRNQDIWKTMCETELFIFGLFETELFTLWTV